MRDISLIADIRNERYQAARGRSPIAQRPIMTYQDWVGDMHELVEALYELVRYSDTLLLTSGMLELARRDEAVQAGRGQTLRHERTEVQSQGNYSARRQCPAIASARDRGVGPVRFRLPEAHHPRSERGR